MRGALSKKSPAEVKTQWFHLTPENQGDPQTYVEAMRKIANAAGRGELTPLDVERFAKTLTVLCLANTGVKFAEASREQMDPIKKLTTVLEADEPALKRLAESIKKIDETRLEKGLRTRWLALIALTLTIQAECRADPAKYAVYVARNENPGHTEELLDMQWFHLWMYDVWMDPEHLHSLIMAPFAHGKSTNYRLLASWESGREPELRVLYITDVAKKAEKTLRSVRRVIRSPRHRAIFPNSRILGKAQGQISTSQSFTLFRKNDLSTHPSFEAAAIGSEIQGNRYDRIFGDDFVPSKVRYQPNLRVQITKTWKNVVEKRISDPKASRIRMIGTPADRDDTLMETARDVEQGRLKGWLCDTDKLRIKDDAEGKAISIWPSLWDRDYLEEKKVRDGADYDYNFRLRPASESDVIIRKVHYFNYHATGAVQLRGDAELMRLVAEAETWLSIDPAGTSGKASSDTGIVEIALSPRGYVFITDAWLMHYSIGEIIERIRDMVLARQGRNPYRGLHWEAQGGVKVGLPAVITDLQRQLRDAGYPVDDLQIVFTGTSVGGATWQHRSKVVRLKNCSGYLDHGLVRFAGLARIDNRMPKDHPRRTFYDVVPGSRIETLANNVLHFDQTRADGVDALTQFILNNQHRIRDWRPDARAGGEQRPAPRQDPMQALFLKQLDAAGRPPDNDDEAAFYDKFRGAAA